MNNGGGGPPKYQVTLKYAYEKEETVVDPLRVIHTMIKAAIMTEYARICPQSTKSIVKKLKLTKNLFELTAEERNPDEVALFNDMARDRLEDQLTFGGSAESADAEAGKSKMISYAPAKAGKDGGSDFDHAFTMNVNSGITRIAGTQQFHTNADGSRGDPVFDFTLVESPERDFRKAEEVPNDLILSSFGPTDRTPFSRTGIAVLTLPFIHVRDDESQMSVNLCLDHFHAFLREDVGQKRVFRVLEDPDCPQDPVAPVDLVKYEDDDE
jgi:hypothetical protein